MFGKKKKQGILVRPIGNEDRLEKLEHNLDRVCSRVSELEFSVKQLKCSHPVGNREWIELTTYMDRVFGPYLEKCGACQTVLHRWRDRDAFLQAKADWYKGMGDRLEEEMCNEEE